MKTFSKICRSGLTFNSKHRHLRIKLTHTTEWRDKLGRNPDCRVVMTNYVMYVRYRVIHFVISKVNVYKAHIKYLFIIFLFYCKVWTFSSFKWPPREVLQALILLKQFSPIFWYILCVIAAITWRILFFKYKKSIFAATSSQQISGNEKFLKKLCRSESTLNCRSPNFCIKLTHAT